MEKGPNLARPNWERLLDYLRETARLFPSPQEPPGLVYWSHPDEQYKNDDEIRAHEEELRPLTDAAIERVVLRRTWPRARRGVAWAAHRRAETAEADLQRWIAMPTPLAMAWDLSKRRVSTREELLLWLLNEFYWQRRP